MKAALSRRSYDLRRTELRRLLALGAALACAAASWHMSRGSLIDYFARDSIGSYGGEELMKSALRRKGLVVPEERIITAYALPRPGWVLWDAGVEFETYSDGSRREVARQVFVVGAKLELLGQLQVSQVYVQFPPIDLDNDGRYELHTRAHCDVASIPAHEPIFYKAVLRLHPGGNELIWLGIVDYRAWYSRGIRIESNWQDEDGDGVQDLAFITVKTKPMPSGEIGFEPPVTVASFKLDRPGGLLRPLKLPEDGCIIPWDPPDDAPIWLEQDADLEAVFRERLPIPDDFQ